MSFDATRAAWAARRHGELVGGSRLLVALAMAELTYNGTGELVAGTRGLAALCGVSPVTVIATQRDLEAAGVIERIERGIGTRPSRWRWVLEASPTGSTQAVDNVEQRDTSGALDEQDSNAKGSQRYTSCALAIQERSNYQDQVFTRVRERDERDLPPALRGATEPELVAANVTSLRDALTGGRADRTNEVDPTGRPPLSEPDCSPFTHGGPS